MVINMVSNKKYKEVLKERNLYQKYYYEEQSVTNKQRTEIASLKDEVKMQCDINKDILNMVADFKQKYLDEQQKRLELAELVERMESIKVCDVEVDFDDGKV